MSVLMTEAAKGEANKSTCDLPEVDEAAYENLRGFEEELMVFLDIFNKSDQETSTDTHFDIDQWQPQQDTEEMAASIPDLMTEGFTCWTDLLMDDYPNDSVLSMPGQYTTSCDFLSIGLAPHESSAIRPTLPDSLFHIPSADSSTAEALVQEARMFVSSEQAQPSTDLAGAPFDGCSVELETPLTQTQAPSYDIALTAAESALHSSDQQPGNSKQKAQKRKRAIKAKDPNAPKRGPGRPRVKHGYNILKHMKAFEEEGGFTGLSGSLVQSGNEQVQANTAQA